MKLAIIGAGALGSVIGFHLAASNNVILIDLWQEHINAINTHGLCCVADDSEQIRFLPATTDPALVEPVPVALITVKAAQTSWAATVAAQILQPDGVAYTLQNGLGNAELLAHQLGTQRVGQGVTTLGATLVAPGRVRLAGRGTTTFSATPSLSTAYAIADAFRICSLPASVSRLIV
jgi:Ketopantoate reductase